MVLCAFGDQLVVLLNFHKTARAAYRLVGGISFPEESEKELQVLLGA